MTPLPIEVPAGAFWCDCTRAVVRADSPVCKKDCPYRPNIPLTEQKPNEAGARVEQSHQEPKT